LRDFISAYILPAGGARSQAPILPGKRSPANGGKFTENWKPFGYKLCIFAEIQTEMISENGR
jgi:hypothetical protein